MSFYLIQGGGFNFKAGCTMNVKVYAYRTPELAMLVLPAFDLGNETRLWKIEGEPEHKTALGGFFQSFRVIEEIAKPAIKTEERMKFTVACATFAEGIEQVLDEQVEKLKMALDALLLAWSQRFGMQDSCQEISSLKSTRSSEDITVVTKSTAAWSALETSAIEARIEMQSALVTEGSSERAKAVAIVRKVTWCLGNTVTSLGKLQIREMERWSAKTILTVIELPVLVPEISEVLDTFVEKHILKKRKRQWQKPTPLRSCSSSDAGASGTKLSLLHRPKAITAMD